ncbi:MAG: hypothetical protein ABW321_22160 [Polyangiales bacterium]
MLGWVVWLTGACDELPRPSFIKVADARQLTAELASDVSHAAEATHRAVMAGDEELRQTFERAQSLDSELLGLVVEQTNLEAQRLSFGPASDAADAFCRELEALSTQPVLQVAALTATLHIREIQTLEAPHIAAAEDTVMSALEQRMAAAETALRAAIADLNAQTHDAALERAGAALDRFSAVHQALLALSRRNSNVRSLAAALGERHTLSAACEASLQSPQADLEKRRSPARR